MVSGGVGEKAGMRSGQKVALLAGDRMSSWPDFLAKLVELAKAVESGYTPFVCVCVYMC